MSNHLSTTKRMLRKPQVLVATGVSNSTLYLHIKAGLFPPGINLSTRSVGWPAQEAEAVMSARIAGKPESDIKSLVSSLVAARKTAS